jgi:spore maturation protein CgeB
VDPKIHRPLGLAKDIDVIFVGSITPRRKTMLEAVRKRVNVQVANTWDPEEMNRLFNRSRIVLNLHLSDLPNTETRIAEVLGAGAFLLTEALSSPNYLVDGRHAVSIPAGDAEALASRIAYYLDHEEEREAIAAAGHVHAMEHHTVGTCVRRLLQHFDGTRQSSQIVAPPEAKRKAARRPVAGRPNGLRIFAAFAHVNWEDPNLVPALESFGEVVRFRWSFNDQYAPDWHRAGKIDLNARLLEAVRMAHRDKPLDLFFSYVSGRLVFPGTIRAIGMLGIPTLNLSLDDKTKFFGPLESTGFAGVADIAGAFSLCWTSTEESVALYESVGARAAYLPEGANPDVYRHIPGTRHDIDVSFIGQCYGQRPKIIEYLKERGIRVEAFGRGWPSGEIPVEKMVEIYNRSRINLGFAAVGEAADICHLKGRDFEVPMSGGLYLTQYHPELENVYRVGSEILCYRTPEDLADTVARYLAHPDAAELVRSAGHRRAMENHTWRQRFATAFRQLGLQFDCSDEPALTFGASPRNAGRAARAAHF